MHATAISLEFRDRLVDAVIRDEAVVDAQKAVATALDKADLAFTLGSEADVVPVAPGVIGPDCG